MFLTMQKKDVRRITFFFLGIYQQWIERFLTFNPGLTTWKDKESRKGNEVWNFLCQIFKQPWRFSRTQYVNIKDVPDSVLSVIWIQIGLWEITY